MRYFGRMRKATVPAAAPRIIVRITATMIPVWLFLSGLEIIVTGPFGSSPDMGRVTMGFLP
jgi:hypothetical protein